MAMKIDKSKMVKNLVKKHKLVPHLERAIAEGDFPWEYKYEPKYGDTAWHPSGDCTPSVHELWLKAKGRLPEDGRPLPYKAFQVGHFWHAYLQHIVEKKLGFCDPTAVERKGFYWWGEVKPALVDPLSVYRFDPRVGYASMNYVPAFPEAEAENKRYGIPKPFEWVTGAGDIAPCDIPGHGEYVIDFKTMNGRDYALNEMPGWVAEKYEAQINVYMDFFDLDKGLIVAIQKDSPHEFKEFEFTRNQELIDAIYGKWKLVAACIGEDIEPPEDHEEPLPFTGPINA